MFEENVSTMPSSIWESMNSWFTPTVLFVLLNLMIGTIAFTSTLANQKQQQKNQENRQPQQQPPPMLARSPSVLQRLRSINFYGFRSHETQTQYIFGQTHQESPNLETHQTTHYIFQQENHQETQTHQESPNLETHHTTHYIFQQENHQETHTHQESPNLETHQTTHYIFRQENHQETQTHYDFQQENQPQFVSDQEKAEEMDELQSMDEIYSRLKGQQVNRRKSDTKPSAGEMPARLPAKMTKSASMKSAFNHFEEKEDDVEPRRPATMRERAAAEVDHEVDAKADDFINRFKKQLQLQRLDSILRYKEMIGRGAGR